MELSSYLRNDAVGIAGKEQPLIGAYARALEIIPRQLCDNAGFDATNLLNKLRQKHDSKGTCDICIITTPMVHAYVHVNQIVGYWAVVTVSF